MDDVLYAKRFLTSAEQRHVVKIMRGVQPGFYQPRTRWGQSLRLRMLCLGQHWSARSYRYETTRVDADGLPCPPIPPELQKLGQRAVAETGYLPRADVRPFDIVVVNLYSDTGRLGDHQDNSESREALESGYPIVSLSIGASCVFRMGGVSKSDPFTEQVLESGDAVVFGRSMRLAFHGVKKVLPDTTPPGLGLKPGERLNLTYRVL